jgi:hypothetical protein
MQTLLTDYLAGGIGILFRNRGDRLLRTAHAGEGRGRRRLLEAGLSFRATHVALRRVVRLFAGILATLMIGGIQIGLLLNSGWSSDPGFLWSIPTLIYVFSIVSTPCRCWSACSRGAAWRRILGTLLFYSFTGCVQQVVDDFKDIDAPANPGRSGQGRSRRGVVEKLRTFGSHLQLRRRRAME